MAVRHRIHNLQRRGNIFYWRPRLPTQMGCHIGSTHFAFSLKQSDHRQAVYMVRRLNLMLLEIAGNSQSALISKKELSSLFRAEITRLNDLTPTPLLTGRCVETAYHQSDNVRADLEVGWAYRLIEKFGTRHILFESENCKGTRFIEQSNVPTCLRQGIVTTYQQERVDAQGPRFTSEIRSLMEEHGLAYSISNVEKAKSEYFKARADILLNAKKPSSLKFPAEHIVEALAAASVYNVAVRVCVIL